MSEVCVASPPPEVRQRRLGAARLGGFSVVEGAVLRRTSLVQPLNATERSRDTRTQSVICRKRLRRTRSLLFEEVQKVDVEQGCCCCKGVVCYCWHERWRRGCLRVGRRDDLLTIIDHANSQKGVAAVEDDPFRTYLLLVRWMKRLSMSPFSYR